MILYNHRNTNDSACLKTPTDAPGEGNGNPLQYSCLENPMDRGAWQATVHRITRVGHDLVTKPPLMLLTDSASWIYGLVQFRWF